MKKLSFTLFNLFFAFMSGTFAQSFSPVDIWPGAGSSYPYGMISFNGMVYFEAEADSATGIELYVSDGTAAGTSLVKDIWPGPGSSSPSNFVVMGNQLFFTANDSVHGQELWVTDGTASGTRMVADICVGQLGSDPEFMTVMGSNLYFAADDSTHGQELWVTDGTTAGTSLLKDIWPGIDNSNIYGVGPGTSTGSFAYFLTELNNKLYFEADDGVHGEELWTTDGTTGGTVMVADIWPGPGNGLPYCITAYDGMLYMGADDSIHGTELWVSDGTNAGTSLLKDINPGIASSTPGDFATLNVVNGKLYFDATTATYGNELWTSDGTSAGTVMVKDIWPGPTGSYPAYHGIASYNSGMYFSATDSLNGIQLWTSDGSAAGTSLLKVLSPYTPCPANPSRFINYNNSLIFVAYTDSIDQYQLYTCDGTSSGTRLISPPISPNADPMGYPSSFCVSGNSLFMTADFNSIGTELWTYGFPAGITPVSGSTAISAYPNPFNTSITLSGMDGSGTYLVQILDMTGREYYRTVIDQPAQDVSVSMPDLAAGVYIMHVSGPGAEQTFKLVKN